MKAVVKVKCPRCAAANSVLTDAEPTLIHAWLSFSGDLFRMGLFTFGGFTGHDPIETQCSRCGHSFTADLNWRLQTYKTPRPVYMLIHMAMVAAAVAAILSIT